MKRPKIKLSLNKEMIAKLDAIQLSNLRGGIGDIDNVDDVNPEDLIDDAKVIHSFPNDPHCKTQYPQPLPITKGPECLINPMPCDKV